MIPVPVLGPALAVSAVVLLVVRVLPVHHRRQWGPPNRRARRRLEELVSGWPADRWDAEVRWHDLPALTRQDLRETTWRHGWFPAGEDPDAEGWPVRFTRDRRRARTLHPPQSREDRLLAALRAADAAGQRRVVLDVVPRPLPWPAQVAARAGWEVGRLLGGGSVPRVEFVRSGEPLGPAFRVGGLRVGRAGSGDVEFPGPAVGGRVVPGRPAPPGRPRRPHRGVAAAVVLGAVAAAVAPWVLAFVRGPAAGVVIGAVSLGVTVAGVVALRRRTGRRGPGPPGR